MKIECTINRTAHTLNVNSNKPLNMILSEDIGSQIRVSQCDGRLCGNCVVLLNQQAVLSCLIPAFLIKNKEILTFEGFRKTRFFNDIERAYNDTNIHPCSHCFESKTLILEELLQQFFSQDKIDESTIGEETIVREMRLNRCSCLEAHEIIAIFNAAVSYRRKRRVRRY
ncbi:MAG: ferredoxin [Sphaerochaetaceae bacterium]|nr:ferredoxin [Sphaerochaetaceae bacterium]MDC7247749.1 ferredoxin [Sphaerochaetaceae bacterium]